MVGRLCGIRVDVVSVSTRMNGTMCSVAPLLDVRDPWGH